MCVSRRASQSWHQGVPCGVAGGRQSQIPATRGCGWSQRRRCWAVMTATRLESARKERQEAVRPLTLGECRRWWWWNSGAVVGGVSGGRL
eukprot:3105664-Amphidinium_carterae.1